MPFTKEGGQRPIINSLSPAAAIPGGDVHIHGKGFIRAPRAQVSIGGMDAQLVVSSDEFVVARVPDTEGKGRLTVSNGTASSESVEIAVGTMLSGNLHPVASPGVDREGNIYTTFSGSRGQKTAVAVYKIDP